MPYPKKNEKRSDYIGRAVSTIMGKEPVKPMKAALGKAYGMWDTYKGGKKPKEKVPKWMK